MTFDFTDYKLRSEDLDSDFIAEIEDALRNRIKNDEDLMNEIREIVKEETAEGMSDKLTFEDYLNMKLDDIVEDAVSKIRIYCDFDLEVEIQ